MADPAVPDHITHDPIYNTVDRDDFLVDDRGRALRATAPTPSTRSSR